MLQFILQRFTTGELSYFRAEDRSSIGLEVANSVLCSHPRQTDREAGIVMESSENGLERPNAAVLPRLLGPFVRRG